MAAELGTTLSGSDPSALGSYRVLGRLGGGGMGVVYLATSPGGYHVAVKVIKRELAEDPEFRRRFAREVENAKKVNGLYTAYVVDADTDGSMPWLATRYIAGPSLKHAVRTCGPLPAASLPPLAAGLAEALDAIHKAGIVHRDLKPSNVLLIAEGPKVIDFGIAHAAEATRLTWPGGVVGTAGYMSPEQSQGERPVGTASDIYSLGAVLAFAATGREPFDDNEPPALDRVPHELRPLLERCLAKDPAARPTAKQLLAKLGGDSVPDNWLPQTITNMFPSYESTARIPSPGTGEPQRTATTPPPAGHGPQQEAPDEPRAGRRGWLTAAAAAALVGMGIAVGYVLGHEVFPSPQGPVGGGCVDETNRNAVPVHRQPTSASATITKLSYAYVLGGTCRYYDHVEDDVNVWYMQVYMSNGSYGYIWVQYLTNGQHHECVTRGAKKAINTGACPLYPYPA